MLTIVKDQLIIFLIHLPTSFFPLFLVILVILGVSSVPLLFATTFIILLPIFSNWLLLTLSLTTPFFVLILQLILITFRSPPTFFSLRVTSIFLLLQIFFSLQPNQLFVFPQLIQLFFSVQPIQLFFSLPLITFFIRLTTTILLFRLFSFFLLPRFSLKSTSIQLTFPVAILIKI